MISTVRASGLSFTDESKYSVMKWLHAGVLSAISSSHSVTGHFLSPKTVILRIDRAALVPFSPWSSDMSQKFIHLFASAILSRYRRDGCSVEMARVLVLSAFSIFSFKLLRESSRDFQSTSSVKLDREGKLL